MIDTRPTKEQVEQIARDLAPDVVRIRFNVGQDWSEHPAVHFRVTLSDAASRPDRLADVTAIVSACLFDELATKCCPQSLPTLSDGSLKTIRLQ